MTDADAWRKWFAGIEVLDSAFSSAEVSFSDGCRLLFQHRVGVRTAELVAPGEAQELLGTIERFRLNAKHLEVRFKDGSSWEARFRS